jgi:hypothetical protein
MFLINNNTNKKEVNLSHDHEHPNHLQETPKERKKAQRGPEALKSGLKDKKYKIPKHSKFLFKLSISFKDRHLKVRKFQNEFMNSSFNSPTI